MGPPSPEFRAAESRCPQSKKRCGGTLLFQKPHLIKIRTFPHAKWGSKRKSPSVPPPPYPQIPPPPGAGAGLENPTHRQHRSPLKAWPSVPYMRAAARQSHAKNNTQGRKGKVFFSLNLGMKHKTPLFYRAEWLQFPTPRTISDRPCLGYI